MRSISSHRRTSLTNFLWKTFTSGLSFKKKKKNRDQWQNILAQLIISYNCCRVLKPDKVLSCCRGLFYYTHPIFTDNKLPWDYLGKGFVMPGTRSQLWAHDPKGFHHLNSTTNVAKFYSPKQRWLVHSATLKTALSDRKIQRQQILCTYITELNHPNLSQFTDTAVGSFWLEEELGQGHLFTSKEFPHGVDGWECPALFTQSRSMKREHSLLTVNINWNNLTDHPFIAFLHSISNGRGP